ncbi:type I-B CRISPR-associated protein Cas7/Csh2 [Thermanaeromonas sp. C210]|uniref:type I-B CRISPR-associated protein Cas7/Csh2 n=1 Tax=Thermanaeromonas sp. C210 TaxID=2731925 RepID=UPI00155CB943|nr:type I-B CRISPR-associated protein Cas7/Csh2 [Thermanaeromonas sp. C210]GFN23385.1 type I-B CRISPR-associated protein Cas7/Csh2 [Thermanaeromonas sp. C210]
MSVVDKNSEILFLYDAKMCNPNGDPDDENRPRFDPDRERCLVSDVRLKRYIRDYLEEKGYAIYVTKAEGVVQATDRLKQVLGKEEVSGADLPALLEKLIDVRLFGATMPIKGAKKGEGEAVNLTGPVQFAWGYSLNRVQMVDSVTISSQFAAREQAGQGTFGKDYRVYYALIGFHGVVSARRARAMLDRAGGNEAAATGEADLKLLDEAMVHAIPLAATRSKIGQYPRLYLRVVFTDGETFMGDPREDLVVDPDRDLRSVKELTLDLTGLGERLARFKERIAQVLVFQDADLSTKAAGRKVLAAAWLAELLGADKVKTLERT